MGRGVDGKNAICRKFGIDQIQIWESLDNGDCSHAMVREVWHEAFDEDRLHQRVKFIDMMQEG